MNKFSNKIKTNFKKLKRDKKIFMPVLTVVIISGIFIIYIIVSNLNKVEIDQYQEEVITEMPSNEVLEEVDRTLQGDLNKLPIGKFDPEAEGAVSGN